MHPEQFYTDTPDQWREVLRFAKVLKQGLSRGRVRTVAPYPNGAPPMEGSIYDPLLFGRVDDPNFEGWGLIRVHHVVHPACMVKIAELLKLTVEQVRSIAWWQGTIWPDGRYAPRPFMTGLRSGPGLLRKQLERISFDSEMADLGLHPRELVLDVLPVPPRHFRPPVEAPGKLFRAGSDDMLYNAMVLQAGIIDFFSENKGEESAALQLLFEEQSVLPLQQLLEQLIHSYRMGRDRSRWELEVAWRLALPENDRVQTEQDRPEFPDYALPEMLPVEIDREEVRLWLQQIKTPVRLLNLDADRLLVQYLDRSEIRRIPDWTLLGQWETRGALLGISQDEDHLVYFHLGHLLVYVISTATWLESWTGEGFVFADAFEHETAYLVNLDAEEIIRLLEVNDTPWSVVRSRNGKYIWLEDRDANGGIYGCESGWLLAEPGFLELRQDPPFLSPEGQVMVLSSSAMEIMEEALVEQTAIYDALDMGNRVQQSAFELRANQWWIFAFNILWINREPIWRTDMPITAAAFDDGGQHLYLANRDELRVLRLNGRGHPEHVQRIPIGKAGTL